MRVLLIILLLAAVGLPQTHSTLLEGSTKQELDIYKAQVRIVYNKLANECPSYLRSRRQIRADHPLRLEVVKELYEKLLEMLIKCRKQNRTLTTVPAEQTTPTSTEQTTPATTKQATSTTTEQITPTPTTTTPTTTTPMTTSTTTEQTTPTSTEQVTTATTNQTTPPTTEQTTPATAKQTTTANPQPIECQQATDYTQSWRRDHNGSDIRPGGPNSGSGYACDMHVSNTEWFRFAGEGGDRMLDSCPKLKSCGTLWSFWTDAEMPEVVGVESTVDVYGVDASNCKRYTKQLKVMRCSRGTEHDFVYKQTSNVNYACAAAFCGMI